MLKMMDRWPAKPLKIGAALFAVVLVAAVVDYNVTVNSLPEVTAENTDYVNDPVLVERRDTREAFATRAYAYGVGGTLVVLVTLAAGVSQVPRERERELFTDVGVLGVAVGVTALLVESQELTLMADGNAGGASAILPVSCLIVAALGSLVTSRRSPRPGPMPAAAHVALGLAVATLLFVVAGGSGRECGTESSAPSDLLIWSGLVTGLAAGIMGLVSLAQRRWVVALVSLPMPVVGILGLFAGACLG